MTSDLLLQLEKKVAHAVEVIELLRMQVEELEDVNQSLKIENQNLKTEHEQWRNDLSSLIQRFDKIDVEPNQKPRFAVKLASTEEECLSV